MTDVIITRPQKIATMRESMEELNRARLSMVLALMDSNDEAHHKFFDPLLDIMERVVANEKEGITQFIADDLQNLRSGLRRFRLPDIDPALELPTPALKGLRSERGNLLEAVDTALEAAQALGLTPSNAQGGQLIVANTQVTEQLIRLDERLRTVQTSVDDLKAAAHQADQETNQQVNFGLINVNVKSISVELAAAKFETKIASDNAIATGADLNALTRAIENINLVATNIGDTAIVLRNFMAARVAAASELVKKSASRAYSGLKTVVSAIRKARSPKPKSKPIITTLEGPPADFDLKKIHKMIIAGKTPKPEWRPWIIELGFDRVENFSNLTPLAGLSALQSLSLDSTQVADLAPLEGLSALQSLSLDGTQVTDLAPLAGLSALQHLLLDGTQVADLAPLAGLRALQELYLNNTQVADLAALAGLSALQHLRLGGTQVTDLAPLEGISALQTLWLDGTQVADLAPLAGLSALQYLWLSGTQVADLAPLAGLSALQILSLSGTQVTDLSPLAGLSALQHLSLRGTQVTDLAPLAGLNALQNLWLDGTQVTDLAPLAGLNALNYLSLNGTQVADVSALDHLKELDIIGGPSPRQPKSRKRRPKFYQKL
jgi:hypothetical protein